MQCISDIGVDVVKTGNSAALRCALSEPILIFLTDVGMLASAETIRVVARALQEHHVKLTVVDPVWLNRSRDSSDEGFF